MGILIKLLLFFIVIAWIVRTVLKLFLGGLFKQAQERSFQQQRQQQRTQYSQRGRVNINRPPGPSSRKNKTSDDYKGGDYIDFEEVD